VTHGYRADDQTPPGPTGAPAPPVGSQPATAADLTGQHRSTQHPAAHPPTANPLTGQHRVAAQAAPQDAAERSSPTMWEQLGGPMGLVDSGLPVVVFVVVNAIAGLSWGVGAAVAAALLIAILRLVRGRPVTQAISGLLGVGVAAFIAYRTGSAKGYFLLGIWSYVIYGGALLLSILVRWPLIGVLWEGLNGRGSAWRKNRNLVRKYDLATGVWVLVFVLRFLVQNQLYDSDKVGWLATARLLMGYPLFIVAIVVTVLIVGSAAGMQLPGWMRRRAPNRADPDQHRRTDPV
jgi:hypothetical protein